MIKKLIILPALFFLISCATVIKSTNDLGYELEPKIVIEEYNSLQTVLGKIYMDKLEENPNLNAALIINTGDDALTHRIAMVRMAQHSIEMQTYIYKNDLTTFILLHEMKLAADRGVKVRILLDDNGLLPRDSALMLMSYYPNIEVRIFNPYKYRTSVTLFRYSQFLTDFKRLNRRLHNKLFIVDNTVLIIGGRNTSRNYFDHDEIFNFLDADVLFIGDVAQEGLKSFNTYWDFHMSVPSTFFPEHPDPAELDGFLAEIQRALENNADYVDKFNSEVEQIISAYKARELHTYWVKVRLIGDPPEKADRRMEGNQILDEVNALFDEAKSSIYISNAYVVPRDFYKKLYEKNSEGLEIHLLTNSLASNDVSVVYAGWINYRDDFVNSGIHVHEFRYDVDLVDTRQTAESGLHSKLLVFDEKYTVVGSLNMDPRSVWLNTEVIAIVESKEFGEAIVKTLRDEMSHVQSWEVKRLDGKIVWQTTRDGETVTIGHIPDAFVGKRALMNILSFIVPESLL